MDIHEEVEEMLTTYRTMATTLIRLRQVAQWSIAANLVLLTLLVALLTIR